MQRRLPLKLLSAILVVVCGALSCAVKGVLVKGSE